MSYQSLATCSTVSSFVDPAGAAASTIGNLARYEPSRRNRIETMITWMNLNFLPELPASSAQLIAAGAPPPTVCDDDMLFF